MHQMCLPQSDVSVQEQGIVYFSRRFGYGKGSGMGEIIIAPDYEGIEGVLRIQPCLLAGSLAPLLMSRLNRHVPDLADPGIIL